jgi:hypothetical protein
VKITKITNRLDLGIMFASSWAFMAAAIVGIYAAVTGGLFEIFYLIPPGFFKPIPVLYLPAIPFNLIAFAGFGLWLVKDYRIKALPMFFFSYCMWDMLSIPFPTMPLIYTVVYVGVFVWSWAIARPNIHVVNGYTILFLFWAARQPFTTLFPPNGITWILNTIGYDALFFLFVWKSFSPKSHSGSKVLDSISS